MQAKMFSDLIKDILVANSVDAAAVVPSLYALQQCLRSGWQTHSLDEVGIHPSSYNGDFLF